MIITQTPTNIHLPLERRYVFKLCLVMRPPQPPIRQVHPYLTLLLNGTGWAPGFPRLLSTSDLIASLHRAKSLPGGIAFRGTNVGDISCDPEGGLEFLERASTLSDPFYKIRPSADLPEVQMMAVDILPTSIPLDASKGFSKGVKDYLKGVINRYEKKQGKEHIEQALHRATVTQGGKLVDKHQWLWEGVQRSRAEAGSSQSSVASVGSNASSQQPRRILLLGSGMVAGPAIELIRDRARSEGGKLQLVVGVLYPGSSLRHR